MKKVSFKKRNWMLLGVFVMSASIFGVYSYQTSKVSVSYATAEKKTIDKVLDATGVVDAVNSVGVYNKESAFVTSLEVEVGDVVKAGQVLAVLGSEDLTYQRQAAKSRLDAALAEYAKAKEKSDVNEVSIAEVALKNANLKYSDAQVAYDRTQKLFAEGGVSRSELDQDKLALDSALNAVESAKAQLALASKTASKNTLKALQANIDAARAEVTRLDGATNNMKLLSPMAGVVTEKFISEGAYLQTGTKLFTVSELAPLKVLSDVLDKDVKEVHVGQDVAFFSEDVQVSKGKVSKIHPTVFDKTSDLGIVQKRVRVEIGVDQSATSLMLGQELDAKYLVASKANALCVDKDFVYDEGDAHYVLTIEGDKIAKRSVSLGIEGEDDYEILSGLSEHERIVGEMEKPLDVGVAAKWGEKSK